MKILIIACGLLLAAGCNKSKEDKITLLSPSAQLKPALAVQAIDQDVPADNYTTLAIKAEVTSHGSYNSISYITFNTDTGLFSNGQRKYVAPVSSDSTAIAYLKSAAAGKFTVTAMIDSGTSGQTAVTFVNALPTAVVLSTDSAVLAVGGKYQTGVSASFYHDNGIATQNQPVVFYDSAANSVTLLSKGVFNNQTVINQYGKATAIYQLQDTSYHGIVYLKCHVIRNSLIGYTKIQIR